MCGVCGKERKLLIKDDPIKGNLCEACFLETGGNVQRCINCLSYDKDTAICKLVDKKISFNYWCINWQWRYKK